MTAPLRTADPTIVNVALGARGYDIAIGRGLLAELGARIAKLRPGAAAAIVSDETVARHHLAAAETALSGAGIRAARVVVPAGEGSRPGGSSSGSARRFSPPGSSATISSLRLAAAWSAILPGLRP